MKKEESIKKIEMSIIKSTNIKRVNVNHKKGKLLLKIIQKIKVSNYLILIRVKKKSITY